MDEKLNDDDFRLYLFESWQDLAMHIIKYGHTNTIYYKEYGEYIPIKFYGKSFSCNIIEHSSFNIYIKIPNIEEVVANKPVLCWVWDDEEEAKQLGIIVSVNENLMPYIFVDDRNTTWKNAKILSKQEMFETLHIEKI